MLPAVTFDAAGLDVASARDVLSEHGIVCLDNASSTEMVRLGSGLGSRLPHPDADEDGITTLRFDARLAQRLNKDGFGTGGLRLHTDRSVLEQPPELLAFWCEAQAGAGGQTTLADGRTVFRLLRKRYPFLIKHLESSDSFVFRSDTAVSIGAMFEVCAEDRRAIRLRLDNLLYVSKPLWKWMDAIVETVEEAQVTYRLHAGQGYIIQNTRWLHGREPFVGRRACKRMLISVDQDSRDLRSFRL